MDLEHESILEILSREIPLKRSEIMKELRELNNAEINAYLRTDKQLSALLQTLRNRGFIRPHRRHKKLWVISESGKRFLGW